MSENWKGFVWFMAILLMCTFGIIAALCAALATYGEVNGGLFMWFALGFALVCAFIGVSALLFIWTCEGLFE